MEVAIHLQEADGTPVRDPGPGDVEIKFAGRVRTATAASPGPLSIILALDMSGSMTGAFPVTAFMASIAAFAKSLKPDEQVRFLAFGDRVESGPDFDLDRTETIEFIKSRQPQDGTRLYDAMQTAVTALAKRTGRRAVVALSDGDDTGSRSHFSDLRQSAIDAAVRFYLIGPPPYSARYPGRGGFLSHVSQQLELSYSPLRKDSAGLLIPLKASEELDHALATILSDLRSELVLVVDTSDVKPGSYSLDVRAKRPGVKVCSPRAVVVH